MSKSYLNNESMTRGLRNNNPFNIVYAASNNWGGKIPYSDNLDYKELPSNILKHFEQFYDIVWGLRAGMKLIYNYYTKYNITTISGIISKYAPSFENDTTGYITNVASMLGVSATANITLTKDVLIALSKAIVYIENGSSATNYLTDEDYEEAYSRLGITLDTSKSTSVFFILLFIAAGFGTYYYLKKSN